MTLYRRSKSLGVVVKSVNMTGDTICVDFFKRPDGTFGFEEYRRDVESNEGWFPIGFYSGNIYPSLDETIQSACDIIGWLDGEME